MNPKNPQTKPGDATDDQASRPLPNPRHEIFAVARFQGKTAVDAYLEAGFGGRDPTLNAKRNAFKVDRRPEVRARIAALLAQVARTAVMERQEAEEILTRQARGRLIDYMECGPDGVWFVALNQKMPNPEAIQKLTSKVIYNDDGKVGSVITAIELNAQRDAIVALAKMKGWQAPKKVRLDLGKALSEMTDDEIRTFVAQGESDLGGEG